MSDTFDTERFYLGLLCAQDHRWQGTDYSLRRRGSHHCVECSRENRQHYHEINHERELKAKRDRDAQARAERNAVSGPSTVLGPLCKRGHDHDGTGQSLRYRSTRQCVACLQAWHDSYYPAYYAQTVEERRARAREWYHLNRARRLVSMASYRKSPAFKASLKRWRTKNRDTNLQYNRDWRVQNQARVSAYNRAYARTLWGHARNRQRTTIRAEREAATFEPFTPAQLSERFALFGDACAYCGASGDLVMEHVVPLSRGGSHRIENIVPACQSCNNSKYNHDAMIWYHTRPFFDRARWEKIVSNAH